MLQASAFAAVTLAGSIADPSTVRGQTPTQQFVYVSVPVTGTSSQTSSQVFGFATGAGGMLTALNQNPTPSNPQEGGLAAIDGQSKYLFLLNGTSNEISMFSIGNAGELSPTATLFASTDASSPISLTTERSGQYLYVGYQNGNSLGESAITVFQIISGQLNPLTPSLTFTGAPVAMLTDPQGAHLYVALGGLNQSTGTPFSGVIPYNINTSAGLTPAGAAFNGGENAQCLAIDAVDPLHQFLFYGYGSSDGGVASIQLQADGSFGTASSISLGPNAIPQVMLVDGTGKFLYVGEATGTMLYSVDSTGILTPVQMFPSLIFENGKVAVDASGSYIYSSQSDGIHVFLIDPQTGALSDLTAPPSAPIGPPAAQSLAISTIPTQNVSGPAAGFAPASIDFGSELIGQTANSQTVTLVDTGGQALDISAISVAGANAGDFGATPNCTLPASLAPNASCSITVTFTPTTTGARSATLTATDNAPGSPQTMQLIGNGTAPQPAVTLVPGSLTFATTNQNSTSAPQSITVSNAGAATLHVSSVVLSGANPSDFAIASNTCTGAIAVNASCTLSVTFAPLGAGARVASIVVTDDAPNSPQSVALSGTGAAPAPGTPGVTLSAAALNFAAVTQGASSAAQTITLTSSGNGTLHISSVVPGGANLSDYNIVNNCVATAYAVNATCSMAVSFAPLSSGARAASITITDDAPNSPQTISLSGMSNPAFTVGPAVGGATAAIINAGQTAAYNLQLTPGAGFAGTVGFTCSGAPANATCTVPGSLQVSGGSAVAFTVTVVTAGSGAVRPDVRGPDSGPASAPWLVCAAWIAVLLLISRRQQSGFPAGRGRVAAEAVAFAMLLFAGVELSGCGGGSTVTPTPQVQRTPQGTSTIVVTPTASTASGKQLGPLPPVQLSLTVN